MDVCVDDYPTGELGVLHNVVIVPGFVKRLAARDGYAANFARFQAFKSISVAGVEAAGESSKHLRGAAFALRLPIHLGRPPPLC